MKYVNFERSADRNMNSNFKQFFFFSFCHHASNRDNSHFRNVSSTADNLELNDDFDVSEPTTNDRTLNTSFNISTSVQCGASGGSQGDVSL